MTVAPTSYRLADELKRRLAAHASAEGISETSLVSRILDEALRTADHPGIVYRDGPGGRRAALAGGPDVWQVVGAVRHAPGRGEAKVAGAAEQMDLPARLVRLAIDFAAAHPQEIEQAIAANDAAAAHARDLAAERARLMAS
ncbi:MAG TPA: hypothetical protein VFI47_09130 [Acidimicrobiales bacterium]|nr:hypothetical protein [Acidimicrobiales bacterium]